MKRTAALQFVSISLLVSAGFTISYAVWYMNMHGIGFGSNRTLSIPIAAMVFALYTVIIAILVDGLTPTQRFFVSLILLCAAVAASAVFMRR